MSWKKVELPNRELMNLQNFYIYFYTRGLAKQRSERETFVKSGNLFLEVNNKQIVNINDFSNNSNSLLSPDYLISSDEVFHLWLPKVRAYLFRWSGPNDKNYTSRIKIQKLVYIL